MLFRSVPPKHVRRSAELAALSEGDVLSLRDVLPTQHFTEPPPRFSEGSLVKRLEELGVGRPSTYSAIMKVLQNRGYVELRAKALRPLERGQLLSTMLVAHLGQFVESAFTSRLESDLDAISAGELDSTSFLAQWWSTFEPLRFYLNLIPRQQVVKRRWAPLQQRNAAHPRFSTSEVGRPVPTLLQTRSSLT